MAQKQDPIYNLISLPGLEQACESLIRQMNAIRRAVGQPETYYLGRDGQKKPKLLAPPEVEVPAQQPDNAQVKIEIVKPDFVLPDAPPPQVEGQASETEILNYAKENGGLFNKFHFKDKNPSAKVQRLGAMVRHGLLKKTRDVGVYRMTAAARR
jgi:hypothetical protein